MHSQKRRKEDGKGEKKSKLSRGLIDWENKSVNTENSKKRK